MITATLVTPNLSLGGAERWVVDIIKHSDPSRIRWKSVAVSGFGGAARSLTKQIQDTGCELYTQNPTYLEGRRSPELLFDTEGFNLVDSRSFTRVLVEACKDSDIALTWGGYRMGLSFTGTKIPVVLCSHTSEQETVPLPMSNITAIGAVSEKALDYFSKIPYANELPRRIIYNGSDPHRVAPSEGARDRMRALWGVDRDDVVIGYLGRQTPEKNPFAAALAVHSGEDHYKAVYYGNDATGNGPNPRLTLWCSRYVKDRAMFFAPVDNIGDVLAGIDVFMLASAREAFSLGMIEAWMANKPVIATPVGSVPELQKLFGQLVYEVPMCPSPVDLACAVKDALYDSEIRNRAWLLANQEFTVTKMADNWTSYLEDLLHN